MAKRVQSLKIDPVTVRRYVEENFSVEKMAREYATVYRAALNEQPTMSKTA